MTIIFKTLKRFNEKLALYFFFQKKKIIMSDLMKIDSHFFLYSLCHNITYFIASGRLHFSFVRREACELGKTFDK